MISCWMRTVWKDESRFVEAFGMGKELSEMTLEELWELPEQGGLIDEAEEYDRHLSFL